MFVPSADSAFARYRASGDPRDLARLFDRTAPELLRFARHLASSEAAAEDLVQETFLGVIEHRGEHDGERAALPWLLGMLVNHARAARRRARRVVDPERLPTSSASDPTASSEAAELHAELVQGIEGLPEPYRPVLRLALLHGLEPLEVARTLERPPGTVRAQLSRGLEALRRALPAGLAAAGAAEAGSGGRGLAGLRAALLVRAGWKGSNLLESNPFVGGLALMTSKTLVTVAALAAAAVLGILYLRRDARAEVPGASVERAAALAELAPAPGLRTPEAESSREPVRAKEAPVAAPPARVASEAAPERSLTVRVLRAVDGTALVGAAVRLQELARAFEPAGVGPFRRTDAEGRARFDAPPAGVLYVHVDRVGPLQIVEPPAQGPHEIEVRVPAGFTVKGRVRWPDGRAAGGAEVRVHGALLEPFPLCAADAEGRFELVDVQSGTALEARLEGAGTSPAVPLRGKPGEEQEVALELPGSERLIAGRVLAPDGAPAAGALVAAFDPREVPSSDRPALRPALVRCDGRGGFSLRAPAERVLRVVAFALQRDAAPGVLEVEAGTHELALELALEPEAVILGRLAPMEPALTGSQVTTFSEDAAQRLGAIANLTAFHAASVAPSGEFRLGGLGAGTYLVRLFASGRSVERRLTLAAGESADCTFELDTGASLTVRCPLPPEARVLPEITWYARLERLSAGANAELVAFQPWPAHDVLEFPGLAPGDYRVVLCATRSGAERLNLSVLASGTLRPRAAVWELALAPGALAMGRISGRLVAADGTPRAHALVSAMGGAAGLPSWCTATSDAQGGFAFETLPVGDWSLALGESGGPLLGYVPGLAAGEERALGELVVE